MLIFVCPSPELPKKTISKNEHNKFLGEKNLFVK